MQAGVIKEHLPELAEEKQIESALLLHHLTRGIAAEHLSREKFAFTFKIDCPQKPLVLLNHTTRPYLRQYANNVKAIFDSGTWMRSCPVQAPNQFGTAGKGKWQALPILWPL